MQRIIAVLLAPSTAVSSSFSFQQDPGSLGEHPSSIPAEVRLWSTLQSAQGAGVDSKEPAEIARLRVRILHLPSKTEIGVTLRDGQALRGDLAGATTDDFALWVKSDSSLTIKKVIRYEDVETAAVPDRNGWKSPAALRELKVGRKVEVLLIDGSKVRGQLSEVSELSYLLNVGKDGSRDLTFDQTASVRTVGKSIRTKLIIVASVVGLVALLGYSCAFCGQ